jgi:sortase A
VFPLVTEGYGYYKSLELMKRWEHQAERQKTLARKVREKQDRLIASGNLPNEEAVIGGELPGNAADKRAPGKGGRFPKTRIIIPKIGVNQVILEGTSPDILKLGPGHYIGMANPGEKGNVGIAGHRVTYTHPFNRLDELTNGDTIILDTIDYVYEYQVERMTVVDPKDTLTLRPSPDPKITLTTCNPKYSARTRLNVQGVLVDTRPQRASIIRTVKEIFKSEVTPPVSGIKTYEELLRDLKKAQEAARKNPLSVDSYINLSRTYLMLDNYSEAIRSLKKGELVDPESVEIVKLYMAIDMKKKQLQNQIASGEKAMTGGGEPAPMLYFELGQIHLALGEYQEAAAVFDRGIQVFPYAADMYYYKAMAFEKMGKDDLALATYNEALLYDPSYQEVLKAIERIKNKKPGSASGPGNFPYRLRPQ